MTPVTLDEFAASTRRVIAADGFEGYAPTVCSPSRRVIKVLAGIPADVDQERAALKWATDGANTHEEFLVAFKLDPQHFKIIRKIGPYSEDEVYTVS